MNKNKNSQDEHTANYKRYIGYLKGFSCESPQDEYTVNDFRGNLDAESFTNLFDNPDMSEYNIFLSGKKIVKEIKRLEHDKKFYERYKFLDKVPPLKILEKFGKKGAKSIDTNQKTEELEKQKRKNIYKVFLFNMPALALFAGSFFCDDFSTRFSCINSGFVYLFGSWFTYGMYLAGKDGKIRKILLNRKVDEIIDRFGDYRVGIKIQHY